MCLNNGGEEEISSLSSCEGFLIGRQIGGWQASASQESELGVVYHGACTCLPLVRRVDYLFKSWVRPGVLCMDLIEVVGWYIRKMWRSNVRSVSVMHVGMIEVTRCQFVGQVPLSIWSSDPHLEGSFNKPSLGKVGVILNILNKECGDGNIFQVLIRSPWVSEGSVESLTHGPFTLEVGCKPESRDGNLWAPD